MAPATVARTTSLIEQPSTRRSSRTSSSGIVSQSKRRCGPSSPLIGVSDTRRSDARASEPRAAALRRSTPLQSVSDCSSRSRAPRRARNGSEARSRSAWPSSSVGPGAGRGMYGMGSGISGFAAVEKRICERSAPPAPSVMQWWILFSREKCSPPSSPSITQISQSGRERSRRRARIREASSFSCSRVPGRGSERWRMW